MKVALDATYSLGPNPTGVGVYSREILRGVAAREDFDSVWYFRPHKLVAGMLEGAPRGVTRRPLLDAWAPACDVFHGLNQRLPAKLSPRTRAVVTFHDLFVLTGEYSAPEFRARFAAQARDAAARASAVITVSEFTAGQVCELLGVERERIHVVHHGVREPRARIHVVAREALVLSVGAIQKRKNTLRLVEAFEMTPPGWRLVLAGSQEGYEAEAVLARIARSPRREDITALGWASEESLEDLYARASIFAFPSLDEGFGMPVLEAMARGVAVLTSNRSALPEVAGDAAVYTDPTDVEAIAMGLVNLMGDETMRDECVARGLTRWRLFSWERAAWDTCAVYKAR
ncbi:MAG: glycosyltransferase family 1 protein [Bryobacteraceae bacterium]